MNSVSETGALSVRTRSPTNEQIRDVAEKLEATFISEMLKSVDIGATPTSFGGGVGEDQFSSLLRDLQAAEIAKSGGFGLADQFYRAMKASQYG